MIDGYKAAGFDSIRIPVTWYPHLDENNIISEAWMNRVQEIVDYAYGIGLYAVLNIHHDGSNNEERGGWIINWSMQDYDKFYERYSAVWTQIAERFRDYSDYLIFESMNEVGFDRLYARSERQAMELLNRINQDFVDIIRSTGGNNRYRHLLIAGYWTDIPRTCSEYFKMPDDTLDPPRLILSVHYYTPPHFAILSRNEGWGDPRTEWGDEADFKSLTI
jgi:endoglucanase